MLPGTLRGRLLHCPPPGRSLWHCPHSGSDLDSARSLETGSRGLKPEQPAQQHPSPSCPSRCPTPVLPSWLQKRSRAKGRSEGPAESAASGPVPSSASWAHCAVAGLGGSAVSARRHRLRRERGAHRSPTEGSWHRPARHWREMTGTGSLDGETRSLASLCPGPSSLPGTPQVLPTKSLLPRPFPQLPLSTSRRLQAGSLRGHVLRPVAHGR